MGAAGVAAIITAQPEWARNPRAACAGAGRRAGEPGTDATSPAPPTPLIRGMIRLEVAGQESPDLLARFPGGLGVDAVEVVPARSVLVHLIVELLAFGLEGLDEVLDLEHVYVLVVGVGVDQQRRGQLLGVVDRRALAVLLDVLAH